MKIQKKVLGTLLAIMLAFNVVVLPLQAEDIAVYAKHPEHVRVADNYVRPYVKDRACLDY